MSSLRAGPRRTFQPRVMSKATQPATVPSAPTPAAVRTARQRTPSSYVTIAVWTISGMRLVYDTGDHDGRIYSASLIMVAGLAAWGALAVRKLDVATLGQLQARR